MQREISPIRKCAVCSVMAPESMIWFKADVSTGRMLLSHAGDPQEHSSSELYFCCEDHAGQFLVTWLLCDESRADTALPRSNDFHLRFKDAAMEFSLSMAIQAFWEEGVRVTEARSLRRCINM